MERRIARPAQDLALDLVEPVADPVEHRKVGVDDRVHQYVEERRGADRALAAQALDALRGRVHHRLLLGVDGDQEALADEDVQLAELQPRALPRCPD